MNIHSPGIALRRREEILRLVAERPVHSQDELAVLLRGRGFSVAQPTLSRDIRELGLAKSTAGYVAPRTDTALPQLPPSALSPDALDRALRDGVLSIQRAGTMVVLKTPPAGAQPIAQLLDRARLPGAAGTIAGDDTVFLATVGTSAAARVAARLHRALARGAKDRRARN